MGDDNKDRGDEKEERDGILNPPLATTGDRPLDNTNTDPFKHGRMIRFFCFASVFWTMMLFLTYEREHRLVILLLATFCLALLYLVGSICFMLTTTPEFHQDPSTADDITGLTVGRSGSGHENGNNGDGIFGISFNDTPHRIRACTEMPLTGRTPQNGVYKVIYAAIVFGRQVRSEGRLHIRFIPSNGGSSSQRSSSKTPNNGWEITGKSVFGKSIHNLEDGFVNAEGEMYWVIPQSSSGSSKSTREVVIYRGILDLKECCLDNGDFQSIVRVGPRLKVSSPGQIQTIENSQTCGRIVRLELLDDKENVSGTEVEMTTFARSNDAEVHRVV